MLDPKGRASVLIQVLYWTNQVYHEFANSHLGNKDAILLYRRSQYYRSTLVTFFRGIVVPGPKFSQRFMQISATCKFLQISERLSVALWCPAQ